MLVLMVVNRILLFQTDMDLFNELTCLNVNTADQYFEA